jgi:hypothetical protein
MTGSKDMFMEQREFEREFDLNMLDQQYPVSKLEISIQAENAVNNILENGDPLKVAESLSAIDEFVSCIRKNPKLIGYVRLELAKHPKEKFQLSTGTKIESAETGTKYCFDLCGDSEWETMVSQRDALNTHIKEREAFLKTVPAKGLIVTDAMTGETVTIYPPSKSSTSSFKITLAK